MTELGPKSLLRAISELSINLTPDGNVQIRGPEGYLVANRRALTILDIFSTATTLDDALGCVRFASRTELIEFTETFRQLKRAGILLDPSEVPRTAPKASDGFGHPSIHIRMLEDSHRTERYFKAISRLVGPEDVVLDIGTGTGVLAMKAARSGARHVYAIEASPAMCEVAQRNFELNGLADRITLLQGWSTHLSLPEPANVVVSEIIGSDPYAEGVLAYLRDAAERLCEQDAQFIPASMEVFCTPVTIPDEVWRNTFATPRALQDWEDRYGLDFSGLACLIPDPSRPILNMPSHKVAAWQQLADPVSVATINFGRAQRESFSVDTTIQVKETGLADGLLAYFDLVFAPDLRISTQPQVDYKANSWGSTIWSVSPPLQVEAGEQLKLKYSLNREDVRCQFDLKKPSSA